MKNFLKKKKPNKMFSSGNIGIEMNGVWKGIKQNTLKQVKMSRVERKKRERGENNNNKKKKQ